VVLQANTPTSSGFVCCSDS